MTDPSSTSQPPGNEAVSLGQEMGEIFLSPSPNVARLHAVTQRLQQLGHQHRMTALAEVHKKAKENPNHPLASQLAGPPSRKYLANIKALQEAAKHSHVDNKLELKKVEQQLMEIMELASSRQRLVAHMLPVGMPLMEPQLLGQKIEEFTHTEHGSLAARYADWLGADLSGKNLDGADLQGAFLDGANLKGTSLVGANLENTTLVGANLSNADLTNANLKGANLGGAYLHNTKFCKANLESVIFDKAYLDGTDCQAANMSKSSFLGLQAISANFTDANLTQSKWLGINADADLEKLMNSLDINEMITPLNIGGINFSGANLSYVTMLACIASNGVMMAKVNLTRTTLQHCNFHQADFSGAQFSGTNVVVGSNMTESNFSGAIISASFFRGANLSQSNFHLARLDKTNFSLTNMTNCSAIQVSASATHFDRADLTDATFLSSKMVGAIFRNANLAGTCFDDCDLTHADFSKATTTKSTTFINANLSRALLSQLPLKK